MRRKHFKTNARRGEIPADALQPKAAFSPWRPSLSLGGHIRA